MEKYQFSAEQLTLMESMRIPFAVYQMIRMRRRVVEVIDRCNDDRISDWATIKGDIRAELSNYLYQKIKRSPMILPVIMEV